MLENWRYRFADPISPENMLERVSRESLLDILDFYDIPKDDVEIRLLKGCSAKWYQWGKDKDGTDHNKWRAEREHEALLYLVKSAAEIGCILVTRYEPTLQVMTASNDKSAQDYFGAGCTATGIIPKVRHKGDSDER